MYQNKSKLVFVPEVGIKGGTESTPQAVRGPIHCFFMVKLKIGHVYAFSFAFLMIHF